MWLSWQPGSGGSLEEKILDNRMVGTHWWYEVLGYIPINEGLTRNM